MFVSVLLFPELPHELFGASNNNHFHCNFNTYLNNIRLDYSCNLLQHSDRSITDICHSAGFGSLRTFNRTFLNTYKMSPRDYRKMICEV